MQLIKAFFLKNILLLYSGSSLIKLKATAKIVIGISPFAYVMEKIDVWTLLNRDFIFGILMAITIDHLIGSIYHGFKKGDFTFKKNVQGLIAKISLCVACGVLFEILSGMTLHHKWLYDYLQLVTRLIVFLYPAGSAFVNMSKLTNGVFPPLGWMNKISKFNSNLDLEEFKSKENENNQ